MYGWKLLTEYHHPDKFIHKRYCHSRAMFLICHVTSSLKLYVTLWVKGPHGKSPICYVWWSLVQCRQRHKIFYLSRDLTKSGDSVGAPHCMSPPWEFWWP